MAVDQTGELTLLARQLKELDEIGAPLAADRDTRRIFERRLVEPSPY